MLKRTYDPGKVRGAWCRSGVVRQDAKSPLRATMPSMESPRDPDFTLALLNVRNDITQDWYRDPWNWCELDWVVTKKLDVYGLPRLAESGVKAVLLLDVPKENFALRPAVVLDPIDRLVYQALVDSVSDCLIGDLQRWAYGWRLSPRDPKPGWYLSNSKQWDAYRRHLRSLAAFYDTVLRTDVVSFFMSIPLEPLVEQILRLATPPAGARLTDMMTAWYSKTGRGLPQRSAASAVLAHLYLRPVDDVIQHYNAATTLFGRAMVPEGRTLRWMDDMWLFADDALALRESQLAIQGTLRRLGLEMNLGKTSTLEGDDMAEAIFEVEHSAVDRGVKAELVDEQPLDALIDKILADPPNAPRTSIRFAAKRMRDYSLFRRVPELAEAAPLLPHGADHLARLFRDSEHWRDLQEWYVAYAERWSERLPWSVGQFGTMFPSEASVVPQLVETFGNALRRSGTTLPVLSVAAQRLSAWRRDEARLALRDSAVSVGHPFATRSLALAALHAGEVAKVVRQLLSQHEENAIILAMLEEYGFDTEAVPVSADFAG